MPYMFEKFKKSFSEPLRIAWFETDKRDMWERAVSRAWFNMQKWP